MSNIAYDPVLFSGNFNEAEKTKKVAQEVESLFLYQLLKEMDATIERDEEGLMYNDYEETYRSLFNQELAREISRSGGIGLERVIAQDIAKSNPYADITEPGGSTHTVMR
jgi:Rod binding domain-containing protein